MMVFKKVTFYVAIAGIIAAVYLVSTLKREEPVPPPPVKPAMNPFEHAVAAAGIIEAFSENIQIGVPVPGLVTELYVKVWDNVKIGDPLLQLDDRELKAELVAQKTDIEVHKATLKRLSDQLGRLEKLKDTGAISMNEIETRANDVKVSEAQMESSQAKVKQIELMLDRLTVRAPKDGTILQCNIRAGEYASASPTEPIIQIGDMNRFQIRVSIDEQNAYRVKPNQKAVAYLKGHAELAIPLEFIRIEPFVVPKRSLTGFGTERVDTRVLEVIYAFTQPQSTPMYIGQLVDVFIQTDEASTADFNAVQHESVTIEKSVEEREQELIQQSQNP